MRWAGEVPDDFDGAIFRGGGGFLFDGREGAEEQATDVGEDGGAAGGDAVFGQKGKEFGQRVIDPFRGLESFLRERFEN